MSDENRRAPETEEDVYGIFLDLFDEVAPETPEEIAEYLTEHGRNPEELAANARGIFKEAMDTSPLDWKNRARQGIERTKMKMNEFGAKLERNRQEIIAAITSIEQRHGKAVAAHFRNLDLENVSDEDLASLLADLEYLEDEGAELDE